MKLHLPKSMLTALIGAVLACNITPAAAGVLTTGSFTYEAGGTTYTFSGTAAIESNYNEEKAIGTSGTDFTVAGTTYNGAANTANGPFIADSSVEAGHGANNFWKNLTNRSESGYEGAVYGQTLLMKGSTTVTHQLNNNGMGNMAIGGLITEATADASSYVLNGANNNSNLTLVANEAVGMNMYIGANTEIRVGGTGQLIAATNGTWTVNSGKTLTLTVGADGAVVFQSAISVEGGGTLSISDGLTFDGGSVTVASGSSLNLTGTVDIISHASGAETDRNSADGNGFGHAEYTVSISDYLKGDGTVNSSNVSWKINGHDATQSDSALSYQGDSDTYYIFNTDNVGDYSSAKRLVVDLQEGGSYDLGNAATTLESMTIRNGTVISKYNLSNGNAFLKGDIVIEGGAELKFEGGSHDALGWNNGAARSISLRGSEGNVAKLTFAYTDNGSTTMTTDFDLQGNALISGGKFNSFGGTITATGGNNEIQSNLEIRNALTVDVAASSELTLGGNITRHSDHGNTLTKTGEGQLTITGNIIGSASVHDMVINGGNTTTISSSSIQSVTIQNARLSSASGQNLSGTMSLTNVTLAGTMTITGGTTTYTEGTLHFDGENTGVNISHGATFAHDGFNYTACDDSQQASILSNGQNILELWQGNVSISNASMVKTADGDKYIAIELHNVDLTLNNGDNNRLDGGDKTQALRNLTVDGGTLNVESAATVSGTTTVATNARVVVKNSNASLGSLEGAGRVETTQNATVSTASGFTGTLAAKENSVLTDRGVGSGFDVEATAGDLVLLNRDTAITLDSVSIGAGHSLTIGTEDAHNITLNLTSLKVEAGGGTLNANLNLTGTATLDMSSALTMGCSVDLGDGGITLSGSVLDGLATNGYVELFKGVDELTHNGAAYSAPISASDVFSNAALADTADTTYTIVYENSVVALKSSLIPEPTTATLSLLALMGLAARRRRR